MGAALSTEALEQRADPRFEAWKNGNVKLHGGTTVACIILNVSEGGALLQLEEFTELPGEFALLVPDDQVELSCRLSRTEGRNVAVEFVDSDRK